MFEDKFKYLQEKYPRWIFMSVVGSHNYGTNTKDSDVDIKVAYLPTFDEFFENKFQHVESSGPENAFDYTVHPVHEFLNHAFKGNMNFWEVFFVSGDNVKVNSKWFNSSYERSSFFDLIKSACELNFQHNFNAMHGMAVQKYRNAWKYHPKNMESPDINLIDAYTKKFWKEAQHAMRMMETLRHYCKTNELLIKFSTIKVWQVYREYLGFSIASKFEKDFVAMEEEVKFYQNARSFGQTGETTRKHYIEVVNTMLKNMVKKEMK